MNKEELRKDYYADKPTEPYSDDDNPNGWANIAHYAEENLENAFKRIADLEAQIEKMKCCGNCIHFDFKEPNYCHKGVFRERLYVCSKWHFGN